MPTTWIFGYGSLIFRPGFEHRSRQGAWLSGYRRRLWQGSPDHRGTPERPGRVATLVEDPRGRVLGLGFEIAPERLPQTLAVLDHREKAGYERRRVQLELVGGGATEALVYLATPSNPDWLGPASLAAIAAHVASARGPSGDNRAYVDRLAEGLLALGLDPRDDDEVLAVARALHEVPPAR